MQPQIAHYRIEKELGRGTFATVYRAFDEKFHGYVALKVLDPVWMRDPNAVERFKQEATTLRKLRHPNIIEIYDMGEADGTLYLAEFLVEGETLAQRIERGAISWNEMITIIRPIAAALDYAHEEGAIHRDLKPQNILINHKGDVFISDFGLVHAAEGSASIIASTGGLLGTAGYMAPEQWRDQPVSPATDVYALTCIIIEMLTGKIFFHASNHAAVMTKHLVDRPALPAKWASDVPARLNKVLEKGLALDPAERIQSAGDLLAKLEKLSTSKPALTDQPISGPQSQKWLWGALAIAAVIIVALLIAVLNRPTPDDSEVLATARAELAATQTADAIAAAPTPTNTTQPVTTPTATNPPRATDTPAPTDTPVPPTNTATPTATDTPHTTDTPVPPTNTVTLGTGATKIRSIDQMVMVYIPAGEFIMGNRPENGAADEMPQHTVYLDGFWIDQIEVTRYQYSLCHTEGVCKSDCYYCYFGHEDGISFSPAYNDYVQWKDAQDYCQWVGGRLPTEAEWEKAARGIDGRKYPWGNTPPDGSKANYCDGSVDCSVKYPVIGGAFPKDQSPYGVLDMYGNLREWVADWYASDYYTYTPYSNPTGPASGTLKVAKGIAYNEFDTPSLAKRYGYNPSVSDYALGFRCVIPDVAMGKGTATSTPEKPPEVAVPLPTTTPAEIPRK